MHKERITLATAKLAKKKGLKMIHCNYLFYPVCGKKDEYISDLVSHEWNTIKNKNQYSQPTQRYLLDWLREKRIYISIYPVIVYGKLYHIRYTIKVCKFIFHKESGDKEFECKEFFINNITDREHIAEYYDAVEIGLYEGLKFLENDE